MALPFVIACGGSTENGGAGGSSTGGSSSGGAATGGSSTGGKGAVGGGGATGGTGAVSGSGGAVGGSGGIVTGGAPGIGPECQSAADCKLVDDCCSCQAISPSDPAPPACAIDCFQSACSAMGLTPGNVACVAGRCVAGFDCDLSHSLCKKLPPECPPGQVPSVVNQCYGPCVDVTQCSGVTDCTQCSGGPITCVTIDMQGGDAPIAHHCVDVPKGCEGSPICACMGQSVCVSPFSACSDLSGLPGMVCSCPNC